MPGLSISDQPFEVAIVGGGLVGLILGLGLIRRNIKVKIYEQARSFREIGAGVAFTANAIQCMHAIDPQIVDALKRVTSSNGDPDNPNDYLQWVDGYSPGQRDTDRERVLFKLYVGHRGFEGCHRAHLLDELVKYVPKGLVEFRKRLDCLVDSEDKTGRVLLRFDDGTSAEADALVGCDGIKSRVRQILVGEESPAAYPTYTHKLAFRLLVPMEQAETALGSYKARNQHMHIGPKAHVLHFPVAEQKLMNIVAFVADSADWPSREKMTLPAKRAEVVEAFADWGPTVRTIVSLAPEDLDKWGIFDTAEHPVPTYSRGRVCIAGDAAHAAAPHHGAGAGIGVEDALALSRLFELATTSIQTTGESKGAALTKAFATFDAVRRERTQWFVKSSRDVCDVYEWADAETGNDAQRCYEDIKSRSHKIWYFDIEQMLRSIEDGYKRQQSATVKTGIEAQ